MDGCPGFRSLFVVWRGNKGQAASSRSGPGNYTQGGLGRGINWQGRGLEQRARVQTAPGVVGRCPNLGKSYETLVL